MATSGFHIWQFQVFNSGAEGLVVVLLWLDMWENFFLAHTKVWTGDLWFSSPALYHCAMLIFWIFTSDIFRYFNSAAEGLVMILFWLDLWGIFYLAKQRFELGTIWFSSPALYQCAMVTSVFHLWQFQVFYSGAEGLVVVLFLLDVWEIFFLAITRVWTGDLCIYITALNYCTTVIFWFLPLTYISYLTLVQMYLWWYCSDWTCERFSLWPHWGLNWGPLDL